VAAVVKDRVKFPCVPQRLSYEVSCRHLQRRQIIDDGPIPPLPDKPPRHDDKVLGVSFFRTLLADASLNGLSLPRTFFGRSEVRACSFRNSDLRESTANWNDFIDVDFGRADLSRCDFRATRFERVRFRAATLAGADLRCCDFLECDFTGANLAGAKLTQNAGASLALSSEQREAIDWQSDDGEWPGGG
jgi:uncharacterized protein YjbI with pentapeptide repeats